MKASKPWHHSNVVARSSRLHVRIIVQISSKHQLTIVDKIYRVPIANDADSFVRFEQILFKMNLTANNVTVEGGGIRLIVGFHQQFLGAKPPIQLHHR